MNYFDGYLIAIGGETSITMTQINDFQMIRLSDNCWFNGPNMLQNRSRFAANVHSNHLYAIGGLNTEIPISKIYIYMI